MNHNINNTIMKKLDIKTLGNYLLINKDCYNRSDEYYKTMNKMSTIIKRTYRRFIENRRLNFWFSKDAKLAIPLIAVKYNINKKI